MKYPNTRLLTILASSALVSIGIFSDAQAGTGTQNAKALNTSCSLPSSQLVSFSRACLLGWMITAFISCTVDLEKRYLRL